MRWAIPAVAGLLLGVGGSPAFALRLPIADRIVDLDGSAELRHVEKTQSDSKYQAPFGRLRLSFGVDVLQRLRAVAAVSGRAGGTPRNTRGAGVYNLDDTLQDFSPSLDFEEAYLSFTPGGFDFRAGLQKFGWGSLDSFQPNDLLNPERYNDPALEEEDERKIGVPAISAAIPWPEWLAPDVLVDPTLTIAWLPLFVPPRIPDQDERWYPPLGRAPPEAEVLGITVRNESTVRNANLPHRDLDAGALAVRFSGNLEQVGFSLYYFDGYDPQPVFDVSPRGFVRLDVFDPDLLDARSEIDLVPDYHRLRSAGFDLGFTLAAATVRVEAAYVMDRLYSRSVYDIVNNGEITIGPINPVLLQLGIEQELDVVLGQVNFPLDALEWGVGVDTIYEEFFLLLQWNQTSIFGRDRDLIIANQESRVIATARRSFLAETLETELNGLWGIQGSYVVLQPQAVYDLTDSLDVTLGYLLIGGDEDSSIGQYKSNDEVYAKLRFFF